MQAEWKTRWVCTDSQEVGLEAAILERVRNSSLVKRTGADNGTGLSLTPKPGMRMVGERRGSDEGERGKRRWTVHE